MMPNNLSKSTLLGVLVVSIILNLFLVGLVAGGSFGGSKHRHFGLMALAAPHGEYMTDWMVRYLAAEDASTFREIIKPEAANLKQAHDQVHDAIKDVASAYQHEPPDPAALHEALDRLAKARFSLNDEVGKIVQESYTKLSADGRHRLADMTR